MACSAPRRMETASPRATRASASSGSAGTAWTARPEAPPPRRRARSRSRTGRAWIETRGSAEAAADPFLPTPGKRRRVTFAEVDAFTLDEDEDEDDVDVPAHGRRDRDPFDFPEDGDGDVSLAPPPAATTTASRSPRPAWGGFGGSPATSPEARPKHGGKSTADDSGLAAPSPEWAKRAPAPSRSRSASPMDADATRSVEKKRNAPKQKPLLPTHFPHSPSAAMAMASPSPPPRGGNPKPRDALPESSDALAALDEAQYALSGLGADQPEAGRLACASSLVAIAADARLRRALAQHGLAPRMCRAALDLCASVLGVHARDAAAVDGGGVIARALAAERRRATSPALGVSAAALLYLSTLELRAGEAAAAYAGRDVAGILAELMRRSDFSTEEDESAESRGERGGARRRLLGADDKNVDDKNETVGDDKNGNASSFGFGALLANGAETKALRTTRDALRGLKFLPHESVDAPTLALLAAHRALAQTERAAARASQREARRRVEAEKRAEERAADGHPADGADHDLSPSEEREARRAEAEGDEAAILGWSGFKESLAAKGAVLETARLADEAAREICQAGARCFSRRETHIGEDKNGDGGVEDDSARACRATARLFRCMRVVEAATFGSPSCADACVSGSLAPAPELYAKPPREPLRLVPMRVNDAIASPAPKSPKPSAVGGAGTMRDTRANASRREAGDERALADVVRDTRVDGIELSPCASPDREAALKSRGADGDGGGSTGAKRRAAEEEDAAATAKRFRTAEALLLTPSPGSKRFGGEGRAGAVAGAIDAAGASFLVDEVTRDASRNGDARNGDAPRTRTRRAETHRSGSAPREPGEPPAAAAETPTFNFSRVAAAVDASIAWLDDDKAGAEPSKAPACGDARPWTMVHALLGAIPTLAAAAATAAHATDAGDFVCGVRTARAGGLGADPRLAAGTLRAVVCVLTNLTNENPAGCAAVRAAGGLETAAALVPWCAALEGLLPGAGPDAAARAAAAARGGVLEPKRATASRRAQTNADANANTEGHDMLNAALCFLVNVAETDADARRVLRALEADAGAMESFARRRNASPSAAAKNEGEGGFGSARRLSDVPPPKRTATRASAAKKKKAAATKVALASRHVGLVELLARVFVRAGGAAAAPGNGENENAREPAERSETRDIRDAETVEPSKPFALASDEVTAEMLEAETRPAEDRDSTEGDGLITQAYAALLVAFLVEGQPALRADVRSALPEDGFAALAGVLERFRAFHEQLESISEESRASLTRVIRWLRGT